VPARPQDIQSVNSFVLENFITQSAYILPFYYIRIHRQIQDNTTETWIVYASRNLIVEGSVLSLSARLSFCLASPATSTFDARCR
jgi:hypothetical protein